LKERQKVETLKLALVQGFLSPEFPQPLMAPFCEVPVLHPAKPTMEKNGPLRRRHRREPLEETLLSFLMEGALIGDLVNEHEMASWRNHF
jgi:hypothetical protein